MTKTKIFLARSEDKEAIIRFLKEHWREDHIFVQAPQVFDWQYKNADSGYNFVLACELDEAGQIAQLIGVLGFIPTGRFDQGLGYSEILLAIWKVRDDIGPPGLGIRMLKQIEKEYKPDLIGAVGISEIVEPIYKAFKYTVGQLSHSALFPSKAPTGSLAQNVPQIAYGSGRKSEQAADWTLSSLTAFAPGDIDQLASAGPGIFKSSAYMKERYAKHPWYEYSCMAIHEGNSLLGIVVWREVEALGRKILRIVDFVGDGDTLLGAAPLLRQVVEENGADYIDLVQTGVGTEGLREAGFIDCEQYPDLILPNYFAPYVAKNIPVKFAYRSKGRDDQDVALFRADSDQDRPNHLSEI